MIYSVGKMKSCEKKTGLVFKQNVADATKTDLFRTSRLEYSQFESDLLDGYIASNFDALYNQGAVNFRLQYNINGYIYTTLSDTLVRTFDVIMPEVKYLVNDKGISNIECSMLKESKNLDDYDVGMKYYRYFTEKNLKKSEGYNIVENEYQIFFDLCTFEELEASVIQHYNSYLLLGVISLTYAYYSYSSGYSYSSNSIIKDVVIG